MRPRWGTGRWDSCSLVTHRPWNYTWSGFISILSNLKVFADHDALIDVLQDYPRLWQASRGWPAGHYSTEDRSKMMLSLRDASFVHQFLLRILYDTCWSSRVNEQWRTKGLRQSLLKNWSGEDLRTDTLQSFDFSLIPRIWKHNFIIIRDLVV